MPGNPFYKEHWIDIEPERLDRYQRMFQWEAESSPLYRPADIRPGRCWHKCEVPTGSGNVCCWGVDRTYRGHHETDAIDPKRT